MKHSATSSQAFSLLQPLNAQLQELIDKPGVGNDEDDRHAPARRALLGHLHQCGVDGIDLLYRCDPIIAQHDRDLHVSLVVDALRMRSGAILSGDQLLEMPACVAMERLRVIDSVFAVRFGMKVENTALGLHLEQDGEDEREDEDGITQEPRAGLLRILTLRGDVMNIQIDEDQAQEIFDKMPDPQSRGLLEPDAQMHRRHRVSPPL